MDRLVTPTLYQNHRFPVEIIRHAVWLYFRFCLSFRDVEEVLFERGVIVTSEAIRQWCRKFASRMLTDYGGDALARVTHGTWTRCF